MKKEEALVNVNESIISKCIKYIKNVFYKIKNKENEIEIEQKSTVSAIDDVEILKKILDGEIEIKSLDDEVKRRLISLCKNREKEVREKIDNLKTKNEKLQKIVNKIS